MAEHGEKSHSLAQEAGAEIGKENGMTKGGAFAFLCGAVAVVVLVMAMPGSPPLHAQATETYNFGRVVPFTCRITAQTTTKECKALTAGMKTYVTDVFMTNNVASVQTLKIVTGTGTDCATGAADLTHSVGFTAAGSFNPGPFNTPLQPAAAGLAVCVTPSAATSYSATIGGFAVTP